MSTPQLSTILSAREMWLAAGVRTDSKMSLLAPESFEQVVQLFIDRIPAHKIPKLAAAELGIPASKVPGASAMHQFWAEFSPFWSVCSRRAAATGANLLAADAKQNPADWCNANEELIHQLAHQYLSNPQHDPKHAKSFITAIIKLVNVAEDREDRKLAVRKLELLEAREAKQKETLSDESLTPEQKQAKMREILGMV